MINEDGYFRPIGFRGMDPIKTGDDILVHAYKDSDPNILETSVVAHPPGYPNQYIIGPKIDVILFAQAFNMLDALRPGRPHRQMNVIITKNFCTEEWLYKDFKKPTYSKNQLDRFGLTDTTHDSRFSSDLKNIGIACDVKHPRFCTHSCESLIQIYTKEVVLMYIACTLEHEWTHVEQNRNSLPTQSLWAERASISKELELMLTLLNRISFKKDQTEIIVRIMRHKNNRIYNYRNGRGFGDHLTNKNMNSHGSPIKDQDLHTDDFQFGY